ncbi:hypothetical protein [Nonomuraea sp. NPDC003709]|uniref:hypothetical protein n=1 Tax=Nonomuraea sp. NPDC003709 TaxID=3154450 RepID=UPI0033BFA1BA
MSVPAIASTRLLSADVPAEVATPDGASESLATAHVVLRRSRTHDIGLWEAGPGTDSDVERTELRAGRVRFVTPVFAGEKLRAPGVVEEVRPKRDGYLVRTPPPTDFSWSTSERAGVDLS